MFFAGCTETTTYTLLIRFELLCFLSVAMETQLGALPPTKDALILHIKRSHFQAIVWKQACLQEPCLLDPDRMGWTRNSDSNLQHLLMTKEPIPKSCKEIVTCSCRTGCTMLRCNCKKAKLFFTSACMWV